MKNTCNIYPCRPKFYYIKVVFKGVNIIRACFHDGHVLFNFVSDLKSHCFVESNS